jgi:Zn-dependent protease with chaperone function
MTISSFFNSWPGMYLAQSFLHSLLAAIVVDTALIAWKIENPLMRQRFRLLVVVIPIVAFPLYQSVSADRGSALFRLEAVFNINRWLNLELWGTVPLGVLFLLLLAFSAVIFVIQELTPILRQSGDGGDTGFETRPPAPGSAAQRALDGIPGAKPEVLILDDRDLVIFSSTGKDPAVYVSDGLIEALTEKELQAALAHEIGHIRRSRRPLMVIVFLLRVIMFYNPVILMEFRRIVQEEEKICDDFAVSLTGNRSAMTGALRKFFAADQDDRSAQAGDAPRLGDRLEEYSHTLLIESRLARLEEAASPEVPGTAVFIAVLATIIIVNYYVV